MGRPERPRPQVYGKERAPMDYPVKLELVHVFLTLAYTQLVMKQ